MAKDPIELENMINELNEEREKLEKSLKIGQK